MRSTLYGIVVAAQLISNGAFAADAIPPNEQTSQNGQHNQRCGWSDFVSFGEYSVHNDVWGARKGRDAADDYRQCMAGAPDERGATASFSWDIKSKSAGVKSYPHVTYGWDFQGKSRPTLLPARVESLDKFLIMYEYDIKRSDNHNVSFDIWLSDSHDPAKKDLKVEVMIWVERVGMIQHRKPAGVVDVAGTVYDFYAGPANPAAGNWLYTAFVARGATRSGTIDLVPFLRNLVDRGLLDARLYVNGVSFGAEIPGGEGQLTIEKFTVLGSPKS